VLSGAVTWMAGQGPGDPVYKSVMLWTLTDIEPVGLALFAPPGDWLHALWPTAFAPTALLPTGAWIGAIVADGGPLLAQLTARSVAHASLLLVGVVILLSAGCLIRRVRRPAAVVVLGALVLLQGGLGLGRLAVSLSPHDVEILGLTPL